MNETKPLNYQPRVLTHALLMPQLLLRLSPHPSSSRLTRPKTAHRTSALLFLLAVCMAVSGVRVPPVDGSATSKDWLDYAFYAMGIDRVLDHFEGIVSGFAAM